MSPKNEFRLDAAEGIFFSRELESIDQRVYETKFPLLQGRNLCKPITAVGQWDTEYTYRMYTTSGVSAIIGDKATDLPSADVLGKEFTSRIKNRGNKFGYSIPEIKAAASRGKPLDYLKAKAAMQAIEQGIDTDIAYGSADDGFKGFVNHDAVDKTTFVPRDKNAGHDKEWASDGADPVAILGDVTDLVRQVRRGLKQAQGLDGRITVVLPLSDYDLIASTVIGANASQTILDVLMRNQLIAAVVPWNKLEADDLTAAGITSSKARMIAYLNDDMVLGSLVPMEFMRQPEQYVGLNVDVPCLARSGGAVIRYPVAVAYGDGI